MQRKSGIRFIGTSLLLAGTLAFMFSRPVSADSRWGANYFPNIELTTQDGKTVHFYDDLIKGKIVAIDLIYTTCQYSCPLETARLAQVQKILGDRVGKDIFFYSITIDPANDTPAVLKAYAKKFHAGPGWTFLTGKKEDIEFLSKKLGLYSDPGATLDGHTPHLLLGNEPLGQWMRNSALDNPRFLSQMIGDFLDSFRRRNEPSVACAGETLGGIIGDTVERKAVVTGTAVGEDLDGSAAEGVGEAAGLGLHISAGGDSGGEGGEDEGITADVRKVGDLLGAKCRLKFGRASVEEYGFGGDDDLISLCSDLEGEVGLQVGAGGEDDTAVRLGTEALANDGDVVGSGSEKWNRIPA